MSDSKGAAIKPPLNNWARIVNSHFLQSPYEGKDWESVRKDLIDEGTAILAQEVNKARRQAIEEFTDDWLGQALAKTDLPNGWVYRTKDKYLRKAGLV